MENNMENIIVFIYEWFYGIADTAVEKLVNIIKCMDKENQQIDLTNPEHDRDNIYIRMFNEHKGHWEDYRLLSMRVHKDEQGDDELLLCVVSQSQEKKLSKKKMNSYIDQDSEHWISVYNEWVEYVPTMFNIIKVINQYIPEEYIEEVVDTDKLKRAMDGFDDIEDEVEDNNNDFVVVFVDNTEKNRKYALLVKTDKKENVIDELRKGGLFFESTDAEYATVDLQPCEEAINMMSHQCIQLDGETIGERCLNGILSSTKADKIKDAIISCFNDIEQYKIEFDKSVVFPDGTQVCQWIKTNKNGGVVSMVNSEGKAWEPLDIVNLENCELTIVYKELLNTLYKK